MFMHSEADIKKVKRVQFGILGPDEIKAMSVMQPDGVTSDRTFDNGKPVQGGLMDPRLGSIDRYINCATCGMDHNECPGHFGHIELAKPMYHVSFLENTMKTLRCVCFSCSVILGDEPPDPATGQLSGDALRISRATRVKKPERRLRAVMDIAKSKSVCWSCSTPQPTFKKDGLMIRAEFKEATDDHEKKLELTAERAHKILKGISDVDARRLGFDPENARPDWMVITVLPVPPPQVRPSIQMEGAGGRGEDDLTVKLMDIVRTNRSLKEQERNGAPNHIVLQHVSLLQYHLATLVTNTLPGVQPATTRSGRPLKSISQRLKGKEGRVRGNLMGKRVDFSARTVITGDPNLAIDEVGVPRTIARNLTYPEVVTPFNIDRLQELVDNGPLELPGARYIIRSDGMRLDLRMPSVQKHLQYGYKVERMVEDGDIVMFNRQPSLHKMSIMSHRVKIMPYSTFRLNLSVTTPYNADFDGDEMNLHVMQSMETRAEASEIMSVARCVVSPQSNKPVMGIVQDTLLGSRGFTKRDTFLRKDMMMNLVMHLDTFTGKLPVPAILKPEPLWTGKQAQSLILPDFSMARFANGHPDDETDELSPGDTRVVIDRGELLCGMLDKKSLGTGAGGVIHTIANEFGPQGVRAFIGAHQRLVNYWILHRSYSIGIGDTIADAKTMDDIVATIDDSKREVKKLVEKAQNNKLECQPGRTILESFENNVNQVLNKARDKAGTSAQKSLKETNNVKNMVTTGSKGSFINISQMIACVGQQNVEGKRIPYGFLNRTLPHFTKDDYGPESRGFVENSYLRGLTPQEFFFHAMGGREGLIDTAVKTAETGYIQRRLVKAMEGVTVKYDGTVRNSQGEVLQFLYGEDGMDAVRLENQKIAHVGMHIDKLRKMFEHKFDDPNYGRVHESPVGQPWMRPGLAEELKRDSLAKEELRQEFEQLLEDRRLLTDPRLGPFAKGKADPPSPVNMNRLLRKAQGLYPVDASKPSDLKPIDIVKKVRSLLDKLVVVKGTDALSVEAQYNATYNFFSLLRSQLASKRVLVEHRLTPQAFDWLLGEVESRFLQHRCQPGEMVGALAAQSIGEPATQMTLNTFHYAGVSAKNVTLGVPRLKEIINVSKRPKTPSLTVFLREEFARDSEAAKEVQSILEHTTLGSVTRQTEIWYDPLRPLEAERATVVEEDEDFVRLYYDTSFEEIDFSKISPWVLRIELDMEAMADKNLLMEDIVKCISAEYGSDELHVIHSEDNDDRLVLRVRLVNSEADKEAEAEGDEDVEHTFLQRIEQNMLSEMTLRGIEKIKRVFMREPKREHVDPVTGALGMVTEWVLDTEGINFSAVASADRRIDHTRLMSNDICEIIRNLGVEAVRQALLGELRSVIEFDGSYVNYRHLAILCDVMTYRGHLLSVTRHGINRVDNGALARCSFEETVDVLMEAACFSEADLMQGVSENIMLGQLAPIGTGEFELFLNTDMLELAQPTDFDPLFDGDGLAGMSPGAVGAMTPGGMTPYSQSPFIGGMTPAFSPSLPGRATAASRPSTAAAAAAMATTARRRRPTRPRRRATRRQARRTPRRAPPTRPPRRPTRPPRRATRRRARPTPRRLRRTRRPRPRTARPRRATRRPVRATRRPVRATARRRRATARLRRATRRPRLPTARPLRRTRRRHPRTARRRRRTRRPRPRTARPRRPTARRHRRTARRRRRTARPRRRTARRRRRTRRRRRRTRRRRRPTARRRRRTVLATDLSGRCTPLACSMEILSELPLCPHSRL